MHCLRCHVVAAERQTDDGPMNPCFGCGSVWFPGATLIKRFARLPERVIDAFHADAAKAKVSTGLKCPDCGGSLYSVTYRTAKPSFCCVCGGTFFDRGDLPIVEADLDGEAEEMAGIVWRMLGRFF
jgi:Zn-finger nucleic acid-binding protein